MLFSPSQAVAQTAEDSISGMRLGEWQDRTRLVIEGTPGMSAEIQHGGSATDLSLVFRFPQQHNFPDWLDDVIPDGHPAIQDVQITSLDNESAHVRFTFHTAVSLNIFDLRPMEGFDFRLVLDFYELAVVTNEQWLDVFINDRGGFGTVLALTTLEHDVLVAGNDLQRWRISLPDNYYIQQYGQDFYSLRGLDLSYRINPRQLRLNIQVSPSHFERLQMRGHERERPQLSQASPGVFLNYDLNAVEREDDVSASGLFELGVFNGWGSGSNRMLARNQSDFHEQEVIRLDTQWRKDNPDHMTTLVLGDSVSRSAGWSRSARFAGVQWGTNFNTQPQLLTMPSLSFVGEAVEPSTVDLFINDALRFRRQVPAGPFTIDDLPAMTGYGEARMVVRDILGREQVVQQNYFANRRLLRAGLQDYSAELGFIRRDYGLSSNDYGQPLFSGLHRYGVSNYFTSEMHTQLTEDLQLAGAGGTLVAPWNSLLHAAVATSYSEGNAGQLYSAGIQHQRRRFNLGVDVEFASEDFQRLGNLALRSVPARQLRAFSSVTVGRAGSLQLSLTQQQFRDRNDIEFVNASYSVRMYRFLNLRLAALHYLDTDDTRFTLSLNVPLGWQRTSASVAMQQSENYTRGSAQLQRNLPRGTGFGYRLRSGLGDNDSSQANLQYQNDYGQYRLDVDQRGDNTSTRAGLRGAFTLIEGHLSASRPVTGSFALVQLPDFPDVRIYADNQQVARTNSKGNAMIPRLRAYQRNRISIEQADLPLNANIESLTREVAPYYRSGITIDFPVSLSRDAFFRVILPDGQPAPIGAVAIASVNNKRFTIGHRGEVFMTDLGEENEVRVYWQQQHCEFKIQVPQSDEPILDLGTVICEPRLE
ncbi:fimbria/pilus outer membrane usher protein [Aliidiomarina minuta]|nr:fimbria/pilus outer membrane usher protein [Aliidiomarina minuta]